MTRGVAVATAVVAAIDRLGPHDTKVSRSQVAFRRRRGFAYLWRPGQYVASNVPAFLEGAVIASVQSPAAGEVVERGTEITVNFQP